ETRTETLPAGRRLRARWAVCPSAGSGHRNASELRSGSESGWLRESWKNRNACGEYCALSCSGAPAFRQPGAASTARNEGAKSGATILLNETAAANGRSARKKASGSRKDKLVRGRRMRRLLLNNL